MFALEISFKDGLSLPEVVFIRRLEALVGASESSHVVVDDMASLDYQLRLTRNVGRRFRCQPISVASDATLSDAGDGIYDGEFSIETKELSLRVLALENDLFVKDSEPPDRAGVRVLRQAVSSTTTLFPAIVILGDRPQVVSFKPDIPVCVGRGKQCPVRIDSPRVSSSHARIGFENREFWVEDLGSTNGTFVRGQPVAGGVGVPPGQEIILSREITLLGVTSEAELEAACAPGSKDILASLTAAEHHYPVLISLSEVARPSRLVITKGGAFSIGRDPGSDMWLGAPHVSRLHCTLEATRNGRVTVIDQSTNGTAYDEGVLHRGEKLELNNGSKVLNFGAGLTVGICLSKEDEELFLEASGASDTFLQSTSTSSRALPPFEPTRPHRDEESSRSRSLDTQFKAHSRFSALFGFYETLSPSSRLLIVVGLIALVFLVGVIGSLVVGLFV